MKNEAADVFFFLEELFSEGNQTTKDDFEILVHETN